MERHADCIAPTMFPLHNGPLGKTIAEGLWAMTLPSIFAKYAVRISMSSRFSYALWPKRVMPTQSFAGPCFHAKKEAFLSVRFEEE